MSLLPLCITLEEHFSSKTAQASPSASRDTVNTSMSHIVPKLVDIHHARIENMDQNRIGLQVLSHVSNTLLTLDEISAANDELADEVSKNHTRLRAFAQLPMGDPYEATKELERCVNDLGMLGALIDNHHNGVFYDGPEYHGFWARAEALNTPIYIHPAFPSEKMNEAFFSGGGLDSNSSAAAAIGAFGFGWHFSAGVTFLRLLASGVFDRHPRLKIILGHAGELLPYMFERTEKAVGATFGVSRGLREVLHNNVWITTSGIFETNSLRCLLGVMPLERVLFSVDYPFSDNALGKQFLQRIREEDVMDEDGLRAFVTGNAIKLLFDVKRGHEIEQKLST